MKTAARTNRAKSLPSQLRGGPATAGTAVTVGLSSTEVNVVSVIGPLPGREQPRRPDHDKHDDGEQHDHLGHDLVAQELGRDAVAGADQGAARDAAEELPHTPDDDDHEGLDYIVGPHVVF